MGNKFIIIYMRVNENFSFVFFLKYILFKAEFITDTGRSAS